MPNYRATVGFNSFSLRSYNFTAEDDNATRAMQTALDLWATEAMSDHPRNGQDNQTDFPDAVITIDRLDANGIMEDEVYFFRHSQSHPFSTDLLAFARSVAAFAEEGSYDNAIDTLEALIEKARALCTNEPSG